MFLPLFILAVLASVLSVFTGAAASLACAVIYAVLSIRKRVDISPVRTILILFAPAFGLLVSRAIALSGPGL
jgi:ABC-type uncharacterized transport system permease subunit